MEEAGGVAVLTLARASVLNALDRPLRLALAQALRATTARCVVLTGEGRGFCAGQDLAEDAAVADAARTLAEEYEPLLRAVLDCPAPVLAAVNGPAVGAGAALVLAADVAVAAESATLSFAFARLGLLPDAGATWLLPRAAGLPRALGLALLGEPIPARRAADWGLVWEAVPDDAFEARWREVAARLASGSSPALRATREALRAGAASDIRDAMALEAAHQGRLAAGPDVAEGRAALRARRPPRFAAP